MNNNITHVLAFDPSGAYEEGKGSTGWVLMQTDERLVARGSINAVKYKSRGAYWDDHIDLLEYNIQRHKKHLMVVIEDYVLYRDKAVSQTNSQMETCRLIGILEYVCYKNKQKYILENAAQVKKRWSDDLLCREGIFRKEGNLMIHNGTNLPMNDHTRDAFRHAMQFIVCKNNLVPYYNDFKPQKFNNYERTSEYGHNKYYKREF